MPRPLFPPVFAPNVSHPMVDDFTLRAARARARAQPPGVPSTFVLPARNSPMWSGSQEIGNESPFAADSNNRQMVLKLEEWGPPRVWSVMLGLSFNESDLSGTNGFSIVARVSAGSGGAIQEFEVDWSEGMTFSCVMNAATITAFYDDATDVPSSLFLRATIGEKPLSTLPAIRSIPVNVGPSSTVSSIRIPAFARNLVIQPAGSGVGALAGTTIYQLGPTTTGTTTQLTGAQIVALATGNRLKIPNGVRFVNVVNSDPGNAVGAILAFELGL